MDAMKRRIAELAHRIRAAVPILSDVAGMVLAVAGVYRLEAGRPGIWLIVAGVCCIVIGFVTQDV